MFFSVALAHRCNLLGLKKKVVSCFPVLYWLPRYSIWDYGMPDIVSGISVGIMHLPQGKMSDLTETYRVKTKNSMCAI